MEAPAASPPGFSPTPLRWTGIALGAAALMAALFVPGAVAGVPYAAGVVNVALVLGLVSLFLSLYGDRDRAFGDRLVVVIVPALAAGVLARLTYMDPGSNQAVVLHATAVPEIGSVALALGLSWAGVHALGWSDRRALAVATGTGVVAAIALVAWHVVRASPVPRGARIVLVVTLVALVVALVLQAVVGRRVGSGRWAVLASGVGLASAGAHLLDGIVSYLAVRDPLDVLVSGHSEGVLLSRWVLENLGPGFILLKWLLGAGVVVLLERDIVGAGPDGENPWWHRTAVVAVVIFVGLGPGLFSSLRVLYGAG